MRIFKSKNADSVLPEVDKYYEGERRDRPFMAWLLALVSIAVVALVIVALFLGGRWAYDKIANNDDEEVATTSDTEAPSFDGTPETTDGSQAENGGSTQPSTPSDPNSAQNGTEGSTTTPEPTPAPSQPTASTPVATPQTGDNPLPSTGPGDLVGVFVVVSALAGGAHYVVQRRKASKA